MAQAFSKCIYCGETKPIAKFNRGHVLPKAFGRFEKNLVLHGAECKDCNDFFGEELELALARDSKEGLDRFEHGLVKPKNGGRRVGGQRLAFAADGGPLHGAPHEVDPSGPSDQVRFRAKRMIGFGPSWDGPWTWYPLDELPPVEELRANGLYIGIPGSMAPEEAEALLSRLGFRLEETRNLGDPRGPDGKIKLSIHGTIDTTILRGIAKIALGYLAHEYPGIARMPEFDEIRRFIRFGHALGFNPVTVSTEPIFGDLPRDRQLIAHVVTVRWEPRKREVVAQVTLLGWVQYRVTLSRAPFRIAPKWIESGHAFNPHAKQIVPLTRNRLLASPLPMMTKDELTQWRATNADKGAAKSVER